MSNREDLLRLIESCELHGATCVQPSIVIKGLDFDYSFALNDDVPYYPACMIKVPLAMSCYTLAAQGEIDLRNTVTVGVEQLTDTNPPAPYAVGTTDTLRNYIFHALRHSDNVATNVLMDYIDRGQATAILHALGLTSTFLRRKLSGGDLIADKKSTGRNEHTARDCALAFELLALDRVPGAAEMTDDMRISGDRPLENFGLHTCDELVFKNGYTDSVFHFGSLITIANVGRFVVTVFTAMPYTDETAQQGAGNFLRFIMGLRPLLVENVLSSI